VPAIAAGHVTFGCLNSFSKTNAGVIDVWAEVMRGTPGSKLLLHAPEGSHRESVLSRLADKGIEADRVDFVGRKSGGGYFSLYQRIDVALDPFPYPGGTTTCDALWMGVPVVTLAGGSAIARAGVSLLSNVGLGSMIVKTPEDYIEIAATVAGNVGHLASLRGQLRQTMLKSPLMDGATFARDVEAAYRMMWTEFLSRGR